MNEVQVRSRAGQDFEQSIKAGIHQFTSDVPKSMGGRETGPNPHELLLGALGACTSITVQMYAKRKGWNLRHVSVKLSEKDVEDLNNPGSKIAKISREIEVEGELAPEQIEQLKAVADKCPIHKLLSGPKQIDTNIAKATQVV